MFTSRLVRRVVIGAAATAVLTGTAAGVAVATASSTPSNAASHGRGIDEFGMTRANFAGTRVGFTYTKGYFCDTTVKATATSGCEVGAPAKHAPAKDFDPLYVTVPLGFSRPATDCPAGLVCVDHPGTVDLTRLEPALKPLYPSLTNAQLTAALKNFPLPGHDHFITTTNGNKPEWWDVQVVGVTSPKVYSDIVKHESYGYIKYLLKHGNKNVVGPIPSNMFLYFGTK